MQMQLGSDVQIPDGSLAAMTPLSEKPRLGFGRTETTVHRASIRLNYLNGNRVSSTVAFEGRPVSLMAQQQSDKGLTNVLYNDTGSLRADPNAKPGSPGSAEDLANGRQAVAEIANRIIDAGHRAWVAPSDLTNKASAAIDSDPHAVDAYGRSKTAADSALARSNINPKPENYCASKRGCPS
jgi:hypothetical protein